MKRLTDEYVAKKEAASILEITVRGLERWVKRGLLTPHMQAGKKTVYFRREDVEALRAIRDDKSTDIWVVKALAMQALSAARATEQRLNQVFEHLGLNSTPLPRDEEGIQYLYQYSMEEVTQEKTANPAWWRFWAGAFFMMDEIYFELVHWHTSDEEPWRQFMNFANEATRAALRPEAAHGFEENKDLHAAFMYFEAGKRHLWYIGYMTCRKQHGRKIADKVFGGVKTAVDEIMAILH